MDTPPAAEPPRRHGALRLALVWFGCAALGGVLASELVFPAYARGARARALRAVEQTPATEAAELYAAERRALAGSAGRPSVDAALELYLAR